MQLSVRIPASTNPTRMIERCNIELKQLPISYWFGTSDGEADEIAT